MNKAILMGRLTANPEMKKTPNDIPVARFTVAVNRRFAKEGQQNADFINCVAWRQTAEFVFKYFKKGSMIALTGTIQSRSWNGADGKKRFATEVVADEVYFTGEKALDKQATNTASNSQSAMQYPDMPQSFPENTGFEEFASEGFAAIDGSEEDLPF